MVTRSPPRGKGAGPGFPFGRRHGYPAASADGRLPWFRVGVGVVRVMKLIHPPMRLNRPLTPAIERTRSDFIHGL
jgi:hypothetical protein